MRNGCPGRTLAVIGGWHSDTGGRAQALANGHGGRIGTLFARTLGTQAAD